MGKKYEEPFRRLVHDLGPSDLTAFVLADGVDPRYQEHILATLEELGVAIGANAKESNFVIGGYVRRDDGVVGLAIHTERMGPVDLFPDGAAVPVSG